MAGNRTLKLSILADVDDLKKKLDTGANEVEGFGAKLGEFGKKAAAAFAVAGAAAAAYAGKLLVDGVKSAIEDEAAQARLARTLQNVTGATQDQIKAVEDQILKLELAYGVSDQQLRPSFERLVRSTKDLTEASRLQALAIDVSAGSGKDLESVSNALAKAYDGNTAALIKLGIGISAAEAKTMSFDEITKALSNTFEGQAAKASDTFEGKMQRMKVAFDEAKESIGAKLLPALTNMMNFILNNIGPAVSWFQDKISPLTKAISDNKDEFETLYKFLQKYVVPILEGGLKLAFTGIVSAATFVVNAIGKIVDVVGMLIDKWNALISALKNNPLSKLLGNLNPFSNSSYGTSNANYLVAGGSSGEGNFTNPFAPDVPFVPTDAYLAAIARKEELKKKTAELRAQIEGRKTATGVVDNSVTINVTGAIDPSAVARQINEILVNESTISGNYNYGASRFVPTI